MPPNSMGNSDTFPSGTLTETLSDMKRPMAGSKFACIFTKPRKLFWRTLTSKIQEYVLLVPTRSAFQSSMLPSYSRQTQPLLVFPLQPPCELLTFPEVIVQGPEVGAVNTGPAEIKSAAETTWAANDRTKSIGQPVYWERFKLYVMRHVSVV